MAEANAVGAAPRQGRAPFSLVFRAPAGRVLPQRIYAMDHRELGQFDLFLVPISSDADGVCYQAVFG